MYTGYSSVTTDDIPVTAPVVFAYTDGRWAQLPEVRARCPHAKIVTVHCIERYGADMYDFEPGCLPVDEAHIILDGVIRRGQQFPIAYAALDDMRNIRGRFAATGHHVSEVRWLPAHYTPTPELPAWADGVQWSRTALDRNLNEYLLTSHFFKVPTHVADETFDVRLRVNATRRTVTVV